MHLIRQRVVRPLLVLHLAAACAWPLRAQTAPGPSSSEYQRIARESLAARDFLRYRDAIRALADLSPWSPRMVYLLARAEALNGAGGAAIAGLRRLAAMGMTVDVESDSAFLPLRGDSAFVAVAARIAANRAPMGTPQVVFTVAERDLLLEDVAYDSRSRSFFVSSLRKGKIVRIDAQGRASDFARPEPDARWSVMALAVDAPHGVLWATVAPGDVHEQYNAADTGRTALVQLSLADGSVRARIEPPADGKLHFFGDMTVTAAGDVFVSDVRTAMVYRLPRGSSQLVAVLPEGTVRGPQNPAVSVDGRFLAVADYPRGIYVSPLDGGQGWWLEHADTVAVVGIDGLNASGNTLIAVQNGTAPTRVIRLDLDPAWRRVMSWSVLAANDSSMGEPTHGVLVGEDFYFIADSQADRFRTASRERSAADALAGLRPSTILRVRVPRR
ncbi:MAG TPA: hypothetical protein VJ596_07080 [Gemmatimonadaceae bacterium]|nr:hypothetical protein [Gemmatimonadaceae bacterium]